MKMDNVLLLKQLMRREHLSEIRSIANFVIDTTLLKPKELKHRIAKFYLDDNFETFTINVTSFGFKHGIQMDADLVFDVRFLPNPYYVEELRPLTGLDDLVYNYVMKWKETEIFFDKLTDLLKYMIPGYKKKEVTACYCYRMYRRSTPISCFSKTFERIS